MSDLFLGPAFEDISGTPAAADASPIGRPITRAFVLAGKAIFTVSNPTGDRYTFKVSKVDNDDPTSAYYRPGALPTYFVHALTGPNNLEDYTYVGMLNLQTFGVLRTRKSAYGVETRIFKVCCWALGKLWNGQALPVGYSILHAGRCGRCGRVLTVPTSIESGFGPECAGKLG